MARIIELKSSGNFKKTEKFFNRALDGDFYKHLNDYGQKGVDALYALTPKDTGETADSWIYEVNYNKNSVRIVWRNTKSTNQVPIVILLQYGHLTRNGSFIHGIDFVNPAIQPIFQEIAESIWEEVTE